jgi:hypothetical protein
VRPHLAQGVLCPLPYAVTSMFAGVFSVVSAHTMYKQIQLGQHPGPWHCGVNPVWPCPCIGPSAQSASHSNCTATSTLTFYSSSRRTPYLVPPAPSSPTTLVNQSQRASVKATGSLLHTTTRYPLTATRYLCVRVLRKAPQPTPTKRFLRPPLPSSSFLRCRLT